MIPSPTERDELFKRFARALFKAVRQTGEQRGIERHGFRDRRLATKDVYRKPL